MSTRPTALLQIGGHQLIVEIDKTLKADTIVVPSYGTLDLLTGALEGGKQKTVEERMRAAGWAAPDPKEAKARATASVVGPAKRRRNTRRRSDYGRPGSPKPRPGMPTVDEARAGFVKRGVVLNDVELLVFGQYFGLNGHRRASLRTIGNRCGLSPATIARILNRALRKLELPYREGYLDASVDWENMRRHFKIAPDERRNGAVGTDSHGVVTAGKVDPRAESDPLDPHHHRKEGR